MTNDASMTTLYAYIGGLPAKQMPYVELKYVTSPCLFIIYER